MKQGEMKKLSWVFTLFSQRAGVCRAIRLLFFVLRSNVRKNFVPLKVPLRVKDNEWFNTRPLVRDEWTLLLNKLIFKTLAWMDKPKTWQNINIYSQQECTPVGCVPPAAVAVPGEGLHQAPPIPPRADPLRVDTPGPDTPRDQTPPRSRHPPC